MVYLVGVVPFSTQNVPCMLPLGPRCAFCCELALAPLVVVAWFALIGGFRLLQAKTTNKKQRQTQRAWAPSARGAS